jgi:voltage-gated potassium channel
MARMTQERWQEITNWPLMIASVLFLAGYSWKVLTDSSGPEVTVVGIIIALTWALFIVDYLVRLMLAEHRAKWFRTHLFDLVVVALPMFRPLRLLRPFTVVTVLQRTAGTALRSRIVIYGAGAVGLLIYVGSIAVLDAERHAPGADIVTFGDAVWWAFVTIATVGYGDFAPVTIAGRAVAVGMMIGGVAVVGIVTATLSSWVIERAAFRAHDDDFEAATRGQVRALSTQLTALAERLPEPPSERTES